MAAYGAAKFLVTRDRSEQVTVLEKMPRPGRKIMITGKGRCNFTNVKDWNAFSPHLRTNPNFVKSAFYALPPRAVVDFFAEHGVESVVERGDRAFPASYHSTDIVDALVGACHRYGVKIVADCAATAVRAEQDGFAVDCADGSTWRCRRLILATGGLSYPGTGSTGDGYRWAESTGHRLTPLFPSLTALVPRGYKADAAPGPDGPKHIDRSTPLSETGQALCGVKLKNVGVSLWVGDTLADTEFGDLDFTDGGIEGPIGFQLSRKAVKSLVNGSRVALGLDLKPGVALPELTQRVKELWCEVDRDPRSARLREKEKCRILLGKLMPWELIPGFRACNPGILTLERRGRTDSKVWVNLPTIAKAQKDWRFEIAGYVGYERAVVTAGGVSSEDVLPKTMESRRVKGLYFAGELLDIDADTGGYNLQSAFATGNLAGISAAASLL
ncbi:MAG: NAD(P)/FAD-dependent oxidoreductase [Bacteroidales bacterium]|nr:NAD(P)/FAD-dependent oxidoreductase [Bacteroidales bacterium]